MQIEEFKLKNGVDVILLDAPQVSSISVQAWFRAGSSFEGKDNKGIAHFLEHMFFKGTKKRNSLKIVQEIEKIGGEINAYTTFDHTCFYVNCPHTAQDKAIDIVLDMVTEPQFKKEDLIQEKKVVLEELNRSLDSSGQVHFYKLQEKFFGNEYKTKILGTDKSINSFSVNDIKSFYRNFYNDKNSTIVVAGRLSNKKKLLTQLEKYKFKKSKDKSNFITFKPRNLGKIYSYSYDTHLANLTMIFKTESFMSSKSCSEEVGLSCLFNSESSPLVKYLVHESTLCNSVGSSTLQFKEGGVHFIRFILPFENINPLLDYLQKNLKKSISAINEEQLEIIKNQLNSSKIFEKESVEGMAFSLGSQKVLHNNIKSEDIFLSIVGQCNIHDVKNDLKNLFQSSFSILSQIPKEKESSIDELNIRKEVFLQSFALKKLNKKKVKNKQKDKFSKFDSNIELIQLKNIDVLYRPSSVYKTYYMQYSLLGGLINENQKNNGDHYLISALTSKGSREFNYDLIARTFEKNCTSYNGFSGKNTFGHFAYGPSSYFTNVSNALSDTIENPLFDEKYLESEKEIILRNFQNDKKNPIKVCFDDVVKFYFSNTPYERNIFGNEESISTVSSSRLLDLHRDRVSQTRPTLTISGDLNRDQVLEFCERFQKGSPNSNKVDTKTDFTLMKYGEEFRKSMDKEQSHIFYSLPTYPLLNKNEVFLKILTTFLSGQSSPIFILIREELGLCYNIQPVHFSGINGGYWGIYLSTSKGNEDIAIENLDHYFKNLGKKGISKSDFKKIINTVQGQFLMELETNEDYVNTYAVPYIQNLGIDFYYYQNELTKKAKHGDFNKFLTDFLSREFNRHIVG